MSAVNRIFGGLGKKAQEQQPPQNEGLDLADIARGVNEGTLKVYLDSDGQVRIESVMDSAAPDAEEEQEEHATTRAPPNNGALSASPPPPSSSSSSHKATEIVRSILGLMDGVTVTKIDNLINTKMKEGDYNLSFLKNAVQSKKGSEMLALAEALGVPRQQETWGNTKKRVEQAFADQMSGNADLRTAVFCKLMAEKDALQGVSSSKSAAPTDKSAAAGDIHKKEREMRKIHDSALTSLEKRVESANDKLRSIGCGSKKFVLSLALVDA